MEQPTELFPPSNQIEEIVPLESLENEDGELPDRLETALESPILVYPSTGSKYEIHSYSRDSLTEYLADMEKEECSCSDFTFRGITGETGFRCKHIWRTLLEIMAQRIPAPSVDRIEWIRNKSELIDDSERTDLIQSHLENGDVKLAYKEWFRNYPLG